VCPPATRYWELAGVRNKVEERLAPGLESLQALLAEKGPDSVDMGFIDADKRGYDAYYELLLHVIQQ
jgi:caffeoyl-CoA O-methyltransferase